jgi:hypothetical protein
MAARAAQANQQAAERMLQTQLLMQTMPRPPQTIYVVPCTLDNQIAHPGVC